MFIYVSAVCLFIYIHEHLSVCLSCPGVKYRIFMQRIYYSPFRNVLVENTFDIFPLRSKVFVLFLLLFVFRASADKLSFFCRQYHIHRSICNWKEEEKTNRSDWENRFITFADYQVTIWLTANDPWLVWLLDDQHHHQHHLKVVCIENYWQPG